jgi:rubrerythrin
MFISSHEQWTCGICETCVKNSHETVRMLRQKLADDAESWVCPECGATKLV